MMDVKNERGTVKIIPVLLLAFFLVSCKRINQEIHSLQPAGTYQPETDTLPVRFGFGRPVTEKEITALDIDVRPDGKGLPSGSGTASNGRLIYAQKCAACHGKTGVEGPGSRLVGTDTVKTKTIGNYWGYATTLYDYINRAMPFNQPGTLTADEVYSLTAFLLSENKIIDSTQVINAQALPKVIMPAQKWYVTDDRRGGREIR